MYKTSYVKSGLLTGTMWDTTCKWIKNSGMDVSDSRTWGNHSNSIAPANITGYGARRKTGYSEYWKAKNIHDLAGNVWEWTNEAYSIQRFFRGGNFYNGGKTAPIKHRYNSDINNTYGGVGFRIALYIL